MFVGCLWLFHFNYNKASNENELEQKLTVFFKTNNEPQLLEIFTPSHLNDNVLLNYFKAIK